MVWGVGVNSNENGEEKIDGCEFRTGREKYQRLCQKFWESLWGVEL